MDNLLRVMAYRGELRWLWHNWARTQDQYDLIWDELYRVSRLVNIAGHIGR